VGSGNALRAKSLSAYGGARSLHVRIPLGEAELKIYWDKIRVTFAGHRVKVLVNYGRLEGLEGDSGVLLESFLLVAAIREDGFSHEPPSIIRGKK